jgi:hypothetical protein
MAHDRPELKQPLMKHVAAFVSIVVAFMVASCGGGGAGFVERHGLQAQAVPYRADGNILIEGQPIPCNNLTVLFAVRAGVHGFPEGFVVESVAVTRPGMPTYEQPVKAVDLQIGPTWIREDDWISYRFYGGPPAAEQLFEAQIAHGVVRGCWQPLMLDEVVTVEIRLATPLESASIKVPAIVGVVD